MSKTVESYLINIQLTHVTNMDHIVAMAMPRHHHSVGVYLTCIVYFHVEAETF